MGKALSIKNLYDKKHKTFDQLDGALLDMLGNPERGGAWMIWGREKNGKTWVALMLAKILSRFENLLYISGEEGTGKDFQESAARAQITTADKGLKVHGYESIPDLRIRLKKPKSPKIVVVDNISVYVEELKGGGLLSLIKDFPNVLFIFLAHEDRGEPYTATAKLLRRLAKIIFYVEGLTVTVSGRCPGGKATINEEKSALYHGQQPLNKIA